MGVKKDIRPKQQSQPGPFGKPQRGEDLDLSSIKSDVSDYAPQRRDILGTKLRPAQPLQPNKSAARIVFEEEKEEPVPRADQTAPKGLPKPNDPPKPQDPAAPDFRQGALGSAGSLAVPPAQHFPSRTSSPDDKSPNDPSQHSSRGSRAGSGDRSSTNRKSVMQVKKRDKSSLMDNLVRINAQREEDARDLYSEEAQAEPEPRKMDFEQRLQELRGGKGRRKFKVPGERMDERAKLRRERDKGLDQWGVLSVPRKRQTVKPKRLYYFKNQASEAPALKLNGVRLELLHTDELMAYYRELIAKGNRDFTEHQRIQNEIKKLELQSSASPRSLKRGKPAPSKSPARHPRSHSRGSPGSASRSPPRRAEQSPEKVVSQLIEKHFMKPLESKPFEPKKKHPAALKKHKSPDKRAKTPAPARSAARL